MNQIDAPTSQQKSHTKVGLPYIVLLALAATLISFIGATFSVTGLAKLFSGASMAVMFMAGSLEFAKVTAAGFLHRNWDRLTLGLKLYLSMAVVVLMTITSLGIFGYLSHAYQKSSSALNDVMIRLQGDQAEELKVQEEITRIQKLIDEIPANRISKKLQVENEMEPQIRLLKKRQFEIGVVIQQALLEKQGLQTEVGPLVYVADAFHINMDAVARWFILLFVSVFDPLAIGLVFATSWALKAHAEDQERLAKSKRKPPLQAVIPTDSNEKRAV